MKTNSSDREKRDEIVKKLDFLADLRKIRNLMQDETLKIKVNILPDESGSLKTEETVYSNMTDQVSDIINKKDDVETILNELMKLKEDGVKFSYMEAGTILQLPAIQRFRANNKKVESSIIKTRVIKAMYQKDLDEATKMIVDLIYKSDKTTEFFIASTLDDFKADARLKRKIMKELTKDEKLQKSIVVYWSDELFKDIDITEDRRVVSNEGKPFKESLSVTEDGSDFTSDRDDLDLQEEINIFRDSGINALITYLQENDIDERSFNIGDLNEIVGALQQIDLINYVDFINKLERTANGEIVHSKLNKEEFKREYIGEAESKNDIYIVQLREKINDKYYVTADMAKEILNLPSIQTFSNYQKLLRKNIDKIRIRAMLKDATEEKGKDVFISLIDDNGPIKLESVLRELAKYTEQMSDLGLLEQVYHEASTRCGKLFLKKKDILKNLVQDMNKNVLEIDDEKRIHIKDIDEMFTSDDNDIEDKIVEKLKVYRDKYGNKEAEYAISEINYMEKMGGLLEDIETNLEIKKIPQKIKAAYEQQDKDMQASGIAKVIAEAGENKKMEEAILYELIVLEIDSKLQKKIDIALEKERDDKKISIKGYIDWVKNIRKICQYQLEQGREM